MSIHEWFKQRDLPLLWLCCLLASWLALTLWVALNKMGDDGP